MRSTPSFLGFLTLLAVLPACDPPCSRVCEKLVQCGFDTPRLSKEECEVACEQQEARQPANNQRGRTCRASTASNRTLASLAP